MIKCFALLLPLLLLVIRSGLVKADCFTEHGCLNGGSCIPIQDPNDFNCVCASGYYGPRCVETYASNGAIMNFIRNFQNTRLMTNLSKPLCQSILSPDGFTLVPETVYEPIEDLKQPLYISTYLTDSAVGILCNEEGQVIKFSVHGGTLDILSTGFNYTANETSMGLQYLSFQMVNFATTTAGLGPLFAGLTYLGLSSCTFATPGALYHEMTAHSGLSSLAFLILVNLAYIDDSVGTLDVTGMWDGPLLHTIVLNDAGPLTNVHNIPPTTRVSTFTFSNSNEEDATSLPVPLFNSSYIFLSTLSLSGYGLTGTIAETYGDLHSLFELTLSSNSIEGTLPSMLFAIQNMFRLTMTNCNQITGTLPTTLLGPSMNNLYLSGLNLVEGTIPTQWSESPNTSLGTFVLDSMSLITGTLPSNWSSSFPNLNTLQLTNLPSVGGHIPDDYPLIPSLIALVIDNMPNLSGVIPGSGDDDDDEEGAYPSLEYFQLSVTNVTGTIPSQLYGSEVLNYLLISESPITGTLPADIGTHLFELYLTFLPNITGTIPTQWGFGGRGLYQLEIADIAHLVGTLPTEWGTATNLNFISLLNLPGVSGTLPSSWGNNSYGMSINLSNLPLVTGTLPSEWGNMTTLSQLSLSGMNVTGSIPNSWSQFTNNVNIFELENMNITGPFPSNLGETGNLVLISLVNLLHVYGEVNFSQLCSSEYFSSLQLYNPSLVYLTPEGEGERGSHSMGNTLFGEMDASCVNQVGGGQFVLFNTRVYGQVPPLLAHTAFQEINIHTSSWNCPIPNYSLSSDLQDYNETMTLSCVTDIDTYDDDDDNDEGVELDPYFPCDSSPCGPGICRTNILDRNSLEDYNYYCECNEPYSFLLGTCRTGFTDLCVDEPCQNNSTCFSFENQFYCDCQDRWFGATCNISVIDGHHVPEDQSGICLNGGILVSAEFGEDGNAPLPFCLCPSNASYYGQSCQYTFSFSLSTPCLDDPTICNNGVCYESIYEECDTLFTTYSCGCFPGFTGFECSDRVVCEEGYMGNDCNLTEPCPGISGFPVEGMETVCVVTELFTSAWALVPHTYPPITEYDMSTWPALISGANAAGALLTVNIGNLGEMELMISKTVSKLAGVLTTLTLTDVPVPLGAEEQTKRKRKRRDVAPEPLDYITGPTFTTNLTTVLGIFETLGCCANHQQSIHLHNFTLACDDLVSAIRSSVGSIDNTTASNTPVVINYMLYNCGEGIMRAVVIMYNFLISSWDFPTAQTAAAACVEAYPCIVDQPIYLGLESLYLFSPP